MLWDHLIMPVGMQKNASCNSTQRCTTLDKKKQLVSLWLHLRCAFKMCEFDDPTGYLLHVRPFGEFELPVQLLTLPADATKV
jgi:hypothetical protein